MSNNASITESLEVIDNIKINLAGIVAQESTRKGMLANNRDLLKDNLTVLTKVTSQLRNLEIQTISETAALKSRIEESNIWRNELINYSSPMVKNIKEKRDNNMNENKRRDITPCNKEKERKNKDIKRPKSAESKKLKTRNRTKDRIDKAKNAEFQTGFIIKKPVDETPSQVLDNIWVEIKSKNSKPKLNNNTLKTGDIYLKPNDEATREAIAQIKNHQLTEEHTLKPKILIFNIDKNLNKAEIIKAILEQNDLPLNVQKEDINLLTSRTPREAADSRKVSWLAEVSPRIYKTVVNKILYIGLSRCRTSPYDQVSRCFRCQKYGHVAKHCIANEQTCMNCTSNETGHDFITCNKSPKCANCGKGSPSNHFDCPARTNAQVRRCLRTDYGKCNNA